MNCVTSRDLTVHTCDSRTQILSRFMCRSLINKTEFLVRLIAEASPLLLMGMLLINRIWYSINYENNIL
jgi:hypothetical protein